MTAPRIMQFGEVRERLLIEGGVFSAEAVSNDPSPASKERGFVRRLAVLQQTIEPTGSAESVDIRCYVS